MAHVGAPVPSGTRQACIDRLLSRYKLAEPIYVVRPTLPSLDAFREKLQHVWDSKWLTNNGQHEKDLEAKLTDFLRVDHLSLFCNGTAALTAALKTLGITDGEVITTPFTFPATVHALAWNNVQPVFCDIHPDTYTLNPQHLDGLIGPNTRAILPVHVYGTPCDVDAIAAIARSHTIPVFYDGAHAFGAEYRGRSLLDYGDLAVVSFHATKLFTTGEGGALISHDPTVKKQIDLQKNFGIAGPEEIVEVGINGKMSEFQAAFGLLQLEVISEEIEQRRKRVLLYRAHLKDVPGISTLGEMEGLKRNYAYFPIRVDAARYGMTRDELHTCLHSINIMTRKYFYPLCSHYDAYAQLPSAAPEGLPVAESVAQEILCLPLYATLPVEIIDHLCQVMRELPAQS